MLRTVPGHKSMYGSRFHDPGRLLAYKVIYVQEGSGQKNRERYCRELEGVAKHYVMSV